MRHSMRARNEGITVLEVLIALGVLVVFLSFAAPSLSNVAAKADFRAAVENVEMSIHMARNTARVLNTEVVMHFESGERGQPDLIRFSLPAKPANSDVTSLMQEYQLPETVNFEVTESAVHFDTRGLSEKPVYLLLSSNVSSGLNQKFLIE